MLSRVNPAISHPQVLCLSPTYELAIQTGKVIETMGKFCPEIKVRFAIRQETGITNMFDEMGEFRNLEHCTLMLV